MCEQFKELRGKYVETKESLEKANTRLEMMRKQVLRATKDLKKWDIRDACVSSCHLQ